MITTLKNKFKKFNGTLGHWITPFSGNRYSLIYFTHTFKPPCPSLRNIKITKEIYEKLKLKGLCRIDYIIKIGKPYIIEINTIPGLSEQSIIPKQIKQAGYSLKEVFTICLEN